MKAITVSQLNNYIKAIFEAESLLHGVEVVGEIEGVSIRGNAAYFSLRDEGATIPCVCYVPAKLKGIENGTQVTARGTVGYWHKAGRINFTVSHVEKFGFGALFLKFKELQERLGKEGFFDEARKKALPPVVRRIGVVTSKAGAVLHDIVKVAHRRNPAVEIVVFPVTVQGVGAENSIAEGIKFFGDYNLDTIIVARGGGSAEDLQAFNTEVVARSVFSSKIPVVSAVGHETDWTLIDFVADLRAPTPSAAAELCVSEVKTDRMKILHAWTMIKHIAQSKITQTIGGTLGHWDSVRAKVLNLLERTEGKVESISDVLEAHNPMAVLRRGYAKIVKTCDVLSTKDVVVGDEISIRMYDGNIKAEVKGVKHG